MKQYEKIFIPNNLGFYSVQNFDEDVEKFEAVCDADKVENVIVMTLEELREVFSVGYDFAKNVPGNKDFQELMQSKGIKL
jgi:hypothetical protein